MVDDAAVATRIAARAERKAAHAAVLRADILGGVADPPLSPDAAALAISMGVPAIRADIMRAVAAALGRNGPTLIEIAGR